jgi:curli biogenesis system outer membrane secretion channel CsgG
LNRSLKVFSVLCAAAAAILSGCATPRSVISQSFDVNSKRLAVTKFDNAKNLPGIEDIFAQQLMKKGFTVVERKELERVLAEQKIGLSGLFKPETTKKIGEMLGVDGLVIGEVTSYSPKKSKTTTEENDDYFATPVYRKVWRQNPDGTSSAVLEQVGTKTRVEKHRVPVTVTTNPKFGIVVKIVDTQTAEVVWVGSVLEEGEDLMDAEESGVHALVKDLWKDIKELKREKAEKNK